MALEVKTNLKNGDVLDASIINDVTELALAAKSDSSSALTTANGINAKVEDAVTKASNAVSTANTASSNASTAKSDASTAKSNASSAVTTANTAASNASSALTKANTAISDSSEALSTANGINAKVEDAVAKAESAVSTANTAASDASTAKSDASTAKSTASTASSNASTAKTNASTALSTANAATTTITNYKTTIDNKVASLETQIVEQQGTKVTLNGEYLVEYDAPDLNIFAETAQSVGQIINLVDAVGDVDYSEIHFPSWFNGKNSTATLPTIDKPIPFEYFKHGDKLAVMSSGDVLQMRSSGNPTTSTEVAYDGKLVFTRSRAATNYIYVGYSYLTTSGYSSTHDTRPVSLGKYTHTSFFYPTATTTTKYGLRMYWYGNYTIDNVTTSVYSNYVYFRLPHNFSTLQEVTYSYVVVSYTDTELVIKDFHMNFGTESLPREALPWQYVPVNIRTLSRNLYNKDTAVAGTLNTTTGAVESSTNYYVSDFIEVKPNLKYILYTKGVSVRITAYYNYTKNFISLNSVEGDHATQLTTAPAVAVYARVAFYATYKDTAMFIQGLNTIIENEEYGTIVERNAYGIDLQHCDRIIAKTNIFEMNCAFIAVSDIERGTRGGNAIDGSYFTIKITHEGFHKGMLLKCNKLPVYYTTTETRAEERITHTGSDAYIEIRILYSRISAQASTENEYKFVGWYRDSGIEYIVTLAEPVQLQLVDDPLVIPTSGTKYTTIMAPITAALDVTEFTAGKDGKYVVLKDESNEGLFPMTYADVVMMSDGQTVEEKIRHILSLLESN